MFLLGLLTGIVVACVVIWLWLLYVSPRPARLFDPRSQLSGIERQTIHQMLAAEMAVQQHDPGQGDVVEGSASEIIPRP